MFERFPHIISYLHDLAEIVGARSYGFLIIWGFILATILIKKRAQKLGEPHPEHMVDFAFYLLLVGIVGSRLLFIIINWPIYYAHPADIWQIWRGGLVFYGGFIAAILFTIGWTRRNKIGFFYMADFFIPMVALNHAWGRLGCFIAGCCHGSVVSSPHYFWTPFISIIYPIDSPAHHTQTAQNLIDFTQHTLPVYKTQLYEALGEVMLFLLLIFYRQKKRFHGQLLLIWLSVYPILRSSIEILRGDHERGFILNHILSTSQFISIFVAAAAMYLLIYFNKGLHHYD